MLYFEVNLPAHLVIIKSTAHYVMGVFQEYSETQILQMIGRAGRPQVFEQESFVLQIRLNSNIESLVDFLIYSISSHLEQPMGTAFIIYWIWFAI